jgi:hypothetical protein
VITSSKSNFVGKFIDYGWDWNVLDFTDIKVFLKLFSVGVLMGVGCSANGNPLLGLEGAAIALGNNVSDGKISDHNGWNEWFHKIDVARLDDQRRINIVRNLYLAYCYSSSFMEDFRVACLSKMIEIAQSYNGVEGSVNFKIAYLLYLSQVNEKGLIQNANIDVVETVINRLAGAVNGDKANAGQCLRKFNEFLKRSHLKIYASND